MFVALPITRKGSACSSAHASASGSASPRVRTKGSATPPTPKEASTERDLLCFTARVIYTESYHGHDLFCELASLHLDSSGKRFPCTRSSVFRGFFLPQETGASGRAALF